MAPELLQGAEADARSDLFASGVLTEMVTDAAPSKANRNSAYQRHSGKDPEPITVSQPLRRPCSIAWCVPVSPRSRRPLSIRARHRHGPALGDRHTLANRAVRCARRIGKAGCAIQQILDAGWPPSARFRRPRRIRRYRWAKSSELPISIHAEIPPPDKFVMDTTGDAGGMPCFLRK